MKQPNFPRILTKCQKDIQHYKHSFLKVDDYIPHQKAGDLDDPGSCRGTLNCNSSMLQPFRFRATWCFFFSEPKKNGSFFGKVDGKSMNWVFVQDFCLNGLVKYYWWLVQKIRLTTWDVWNLVKNGIKYLSTAARCLPSTVWWKSTNYMGYNKFEKTTLGPFLQDHVDRNPTILKVSSMSTLHRSKDLNVTFLYELT